MSPEPARPDQTMRLRRLATAALTPHETRAIRVLLWAAFPPGDEGFTEDDWEHALGGVHVVLDIEGAIVAHASVAERGLHIGERPTRTGYVEAVAVDPARQTSGFGTVVMHEIDDEIDRHFWLGAPGTRADHFSERLGARTRWAAYSRPPGAGRRGGRCRTPPP